MASRAHRFNPFTRTAMSTLTMRDGTQWCFLRHNDRLAFGHKAFAIHWVPQTGYYHLKEKGETVFVAKTPLECLAVASEYLLDSMANQFVPCWDCP